MRKATLLVLCCVLFGARLAASYPALDFPHSPPHDPSYDLKNTEFEGKQAVTCRSCHVIYGNQEGYFTSNWSETESLDNTPANSLCQSCHNNNIAIEFPTHSSESIDEDKGKWSVECKTCHWVHQQPQFREYGEESYLTSGFSTSIEGNVLTFAGAGWEPDAFAGLILIPNLQNDYYNYRIISNTSDSVTVAEDIFEATGGDEFAVIYGKLIQSSIDLSEINIQPPNLPKSGIKNVKFLGYGTPNAFASGDFDGDGVYDGICEVCHTRTDYHRNNDNTPPNGEGVPNRDHNKDRVCTQCHMHKNGFRGMGDGAHDSHVGTDYGPNMTCVSGDYACHGAEEIPLFFDKKGFALTEACDDCHSPEGVQILKEKSVEDGYWKRPGSSLGEESSWLAELGEESFCGSCHDETPGNTVMDGSGNAAPNVLGDNATFGFYLKGHGKALGNYEKLAYQEDGEDGNPAANKKCGDCHDTTSEHFNSATKRLKPGYENDQNNSNCNNCHSVGGIATSPPDLYVNPDLTDPQPSDYEGGKHGVLLCSHCHDVHGRYVDNLETVKSTGPGMIVNEDGVRALCLNCHNANHNNTTAEPGSAECFVCHVDGGFAGAPMHPQSPPEAHEDASVEACSKCHNPHNPPHGKGSTGAGCVECHGHDAGTAYDSDKSAPWTPGAVASQGTGTTQSHSTHTELDVDDAKGPAIYCDSCHDIANFPYFKSGVDANGDGNFTLAETDVCDPCHSSGGTYDGLNDLDVGAKNNWKTGIYEEDSVTLKADKEKWCATCHDESPATIYNIAAPNIVGDEDGAFTYGTGYGFYKTGHGLPSTETYPSSGGIVAGAGVSCNDCHDYSLKHIDGAARTYNHTAALGALDDYRNGYRLKLINGQQPMLLPRPHSQTPTATAFRLCLSCHDGAPFLDSTSMDTNLRNIRNGEWKNRHYSHLWNIPPNNLVFSSDWTSFGSSGYDSYASCITCHNVHGSTNMAMVRDGKLINKEPFFDLAYNNSTVSFLCKGNPKQLPTPANVPLSQSTGVVWNPLKLAESKVCDTCHAGSCGFDETFDRVPFNKPGPSILQVYGAIGRSRLFVNFSENVFSEPGASGDLGIADLVFVDSHNIRSISSVIHTAGESSAFVVLSGTLNIFDFGVDALAAASNNSIFDMLGIPMDVAPVVVVKDALPPSISNQLPSPGSLGAPADGNISFTLSDEDSGVYWKNFFIQILGDKGYSKTYVYTNTARYSKTGTPASYDYVVDPDLNFGAGEVITAKVTVLDMVGNKLDAATWSFTAAP